MLLLPWADEPCQVVSVTEPFSIASNAGWADAVAARLKDACCSDRAPLLAWLCEGLPALAFTELGSGVVQLACRVAAGIERNVLTSKFQGSILDLCASPHGYQVLTTLVETMPVSAITFIARELTGKGGEIARSRFGYRVLEAMIMHCSESQMAGLIDEIIADTVQLSRHTYGNCVVQHLLEYGTDSCQSSIVRHMMPEMCSLAMDRTASHVVQKALDFSEVRQCSIAMAMVQADNPISLADVACSRCGSSVLAELAQSASCAEDLRLELGKALPRLSRCKFGRRVVAKFDLTLSPGTH
jgi:hypothetical protein